jgi:hypothetical protein
MFALSEYGVVLTNMVFHVQVVQEFKDIRIELNRISTGRKLRKRRSTQSGDREHLV